MGIPILPHTQPVNFYNALQGTHRMAHEGQKDVVRKDEFAVIAEYGTNDGALKLGFFIADIPPSARE